MVAKDFHCKKARFPPNFGWGFRSCPRCPRITSWLRSFGTSSFHKKVEYAVCTQRLDFQPQKVLDWALTFFHFFLPRWVDELGHEGRREVENQQEPFVCFRWFFTFYHGKSPHITTRVLVLNIFYVHPYLGRWSNLTHFFQNGLVQPPTRPLFWGIFSWCLLATTFFANKSKDLIAHLLLQTLDPVTPDLKLLIQERLKENYQILDDSKESENWQLLRFHNLPNHIWGTGFIYLP